MTDRDLLKKVILKTEVPLVLKGICEWPLLKWSPEDWAEKLGDKQLPFRSKAFGSSSSRGPEWESECSVETMTAKDFMARAAESSEDRWFYFDYKYMHEWFESDGDVYKHVTWDGFGFPGRDASESTIWMGSKGAHTPCHQDTYGRNLVVQVTGRKQWILFPPESGGLKPTRVPYEESSVYSQLNFSSPFDLKPFNGLHGCRMVVLEPGDALVVPPKWWHYVETISPIAISVNSWIPCNDLDAETRVEEALIRLLVAQICKDLPENKFKSILNPNEEYLSEMPLAVAILQVESSVSEFLKNRSRKIGAKRIKLEDEPSSSNESTRTEVGENTDIDKLITNSSVIHKVNESNVEEFKSFLAKNTKKNLKRQCTEESNDGEEDHLTNLTTSIINSFCEPSVIKLVKENLIEKFK